MWHQSVRYEKNWIFLNFFKLAAAILKKFSTPRCEIKVWYMKKLDFLSFQKVWCSHIPFLLIIVLTSTGKFVNLKNISKYTEHLVSTLSHFCISNSVISLYSDTDFTSLKGKQLSNMPYILLSKVYSNISRSKRVTKVNTSHTLIQAVAQIQLKQKYTFELF